MLQIFKKNLISKLKKYVQIHITEKLRYNTYQTQTIILKSEMF